MKNALALVAAAVLIVTAASRPTQAHDGLVPVTPPELASNNIGDVVADYRCSEGPTYNLYHGAYYGGQPPAVYLGYAYRPFYRYTAYRIYPRTYACAGYPYHYVGWRRW